MKKSILLEDVGRFKNYKIYSDFSVEPYPRVIRIEPSGICNLKCIHCPTGIRDDVGRGIMKKEVFDRIFEQLKKYVKADIAVLYHGGESLLNKDVFEMAARLKKLGINYIKMDSNGMLLGDELIEKILESDIDSIYFSIDGLSPNENNYIRRGADFEKIARNILTLMKRRRQRKQKKPEISIANTQIPSRMQILNDEIIQIPKYLKDYFREFIDDIGVIETYMVKWPGFNQMDGYEVLEGPGCQHLNYCGNVIETITFRWNGDVVPCCLDLASDYVIGNIMKESLEDIWNNERYRKIRKSIYTRNNIDLCSDCYVIKPKVFVVKQ